MSISRFLLSFLLLLPLTGCSDPAGLFLGLSERFGLAASEPPAVSAPPPQALGVAALGRLEPRDGVVRVAGPSGPSVVIAELRVEEGDRVKVGEVLATLDTLNLFKADVARLRAEYENAERDRERNLQLYEGRVVSDSQHDGWETRVRVARHALRRAQAELERAQVRAPFTGQVLVIHARAGERVGSDGVLELGRTDEMFAVAEVYEADVGRVQVGQAARVTSPALSHPLEGTVERVALKVRKQDALGTDPAARKDGRIVEVEIRLADASEAAAFTNLQVEIQLGP